MREILSDFLYTAPVDEDADAMPSPDRLRNKILVKAKRLPPGKSQEDDVDDGEDDDDALDAADVAEEEEQEEEDIDGKEKKHKKASKVRK